MRAHHRDRRGGRSPHPAARSEARRTRLPSETVRIIVLIALLAATVIIAAALFGALTQALQAVTAFCVLSTTLVGLTIALTQLQTMRAQQQENARKHDSIDPLVIEAIAAGYAAGIQAQASAPVNDHDLNPSYSARDRELKPAHDPDCDAAAGGA